MIKKKIVGQHNGKQYEVDITQHETWTIHGMWPSGYNIVRVVIDGVEHTSNSKHLNTEELHEFVDLNIGKE